MAEEQNAVVTVATWFGAEGDSFERTESPLAALIWRNSTSPVTSLSTPLFHGQYRVFVMPRNDIWEKVPSVTFVGVKAMAS